MTDKSIKIGVVLLLLGTSFLISFAFFCIDNTRSETFFRQNQENIKSLVLQIDSLERIINSTFKEMKDTTIIHVFPQEIKIYCDTKDDIIALKPYGFRIVAYLSDDYKFYNNHYLINKDTSKIIKYYN